MGINELNNAWIEAGQKVSDLNEKLNVALMDDSFDQAAFADLKEQRDQAKQRRNALKDQLNEARAAEVVKMHDEDKKPLTDSELSMKDKFVKYWQRWLDDSRRHSHDYQHFGTSICVPAELGPCGIRNDRIWFAGLRKVLRYQAIGITG